MPPGTRIAVLGLSSSLRILQGFTSDPAILIAAVDTKKNRALPSPFIDNDSANVLGSQADDQSDLGNDDVAAGIQQFANELATEQQDIRNRMTLEALNQIAAYVAGIKGRKNLIWFTDGMPINMFPTGGTYDLQGITDYSKDLRKTTDLLTAAEVSVYPVDARKLFNNPATGADQGLATINKYTGARVAVNARTFQEKKGQEQLGMEAVAEATGGIAYHNTNDLKGAVTKAIANGANYYSVSYVPPDLDFDGRYHGIEVEVDRPNVHLGYRKGYNGDDIQHNAVTPTLPLTTSAPEPYGNNMQASMGRGVPTASQILFSVGVQPDGKPADPPLLGTLDPKLQGKPLVRYVIQYSCPARQITFTAGPGGTSKAAVEFDVAAYDVFGKRISGLSQTFNLQLEAEKYQQFLKTPFRFYQQIDLPLGEVFLRVGVLDGVSDKVGTLEIPLIVKKQPASIGQRAGRKRWQLDPPFRRPDRCEDFACMSLQRTRIMPLIFGNRFLWETSQENNRRLASLPVNPPDRKCTYQGLGDSDALPQIHRLDANVLPAGSGHGLLPGHRGSGICRHRWQPASADSVHEPTGRRR